MNQINLFLTEEALDKLIYNLTLLQKFGKPEVDKVWLQNGSGQIVFIKQGKTNEE